MRDGSISIRFLFLNPDREKTDELSKIEGLAWELREQKKMRGGSALNKAFNSETILGDAIKRHISSRINSKDLQNISEPTGVNRATCILPFFIECDLTADSSIRDGPCIQIVPAII